MEKNISKLYNFENSKLPSIEKPWMKYYTEEQKNVKTPKRTLYEHLYNSNLNNMELLAIDYYGTKITFKELFKKIDECSKAFVNIGVKKGDIVAICMPNIPEAIISVYALNKIGAISNMIHPLKSQNEIESYLKETNSKYIVALDSSVEKIKDSNVTIISCSAKNSMPLIIKAIYNVKQFKEKYNLSEKIKQSKNKESNSSKIINWNDFIKNGKNSIYNDNIYQKDDIAVMIHTGGTSGDSKTVALSSDNFNSMITQFLATADNFSVGDKMLTIMPIFHGFGLCSSIHLPLCFGVSVILVPKFNKEDFSSLLKKHPNHIIGVPTLFKAMMTNEEINKMDLSFIKYVVAGGDSMQNEQDFNDFLHEHNSNSTLYKGYGLSETVAGATFAFGECNKIGSIGIPMVNTNLKIVDPITKIELGYNKIGEICISGPTVMAGGYYNRKIDNAIEIDSNGTRWLHTGDIGHMDSDGVIYYNQRLDRMFQCSGVNVYPDSIENQITAFDEVDSCLVVPKKHDYKGKVPVAFIKLKDGSITISPELLEKIKTGCKLNLDRYHQPVEIIAIQNFPSTLIGKTDYKTLTEMVNLSIDNQYSNKNMEDLKIKQKIK